MGAENIGLEEILRTQKGTKEQQEATVGKKQVFNGCRVVGLTVPNGDINRNASAAFFIGGKNLGWKQISRKSDSIFLNILTSLVKAMEKGDPIYVEVEDGFITRVFLLP